MRRIGQRSLQRFQIVQHLLQFHLHCLSLSPPSPSLKNALKFGPIRIATFLARSVYMRCTLPLRFFFWRNWNLAAKELPELVCESVRLRVDQQQTLLPFALLGWVEAGPIIIWAGILGSCMTAKYAFGVVGTEFHFRFC